MQLLSIKPQSYETHNHRGGSLLKILKKTYKTDLFSFVFNKVWLLIKAWVSLLCFVSHKRTPALLFFIFSLNASCLLCLLLLFTCVFISHLVFDFYFHLYRHLNFTIIIGWVLFLFYLCFYVHYTFTWGTLCLQSVCFKASQAALLL